MKVEDIFRTDMVSTFHLAIMILLQIEGGFGRTVPGDQWVHPEGQRSDQRPGWRPRFGDRAPQLVVVGPQMDKARRRARLDTGLLGIRLASDDDGAWDGRRNPFPKLHVAEESA